MYDAIDHTSQWKKLAKKQGLPTNIVNLVAGNKPIKLTPKLVDRWAERALPIVKEKMKDSVIHESLTEKTQRKVFDSLLPLRVRGVYELPILHYKNL